MKSLLVLALVVASVEVSVLAEAPQRPRNSPEQVLRRYFSMEQDGTLLTRQGLRNAGMLFERPAAESYDGTFCLMGNLSQDLFGPGPLRAGEGPLLVKEIRAEIVIMDCLGTIDQLLRYRSLPNTGPGKNLRSLKLFLSAKHWERAPDGKTEKEVVGPPEWRIEGRPSRSASVDAAIIYVTKMSAKTTDPAIKKNALRTLAVLKHSR